MIKNIINNLTNDELDRLDMSDFIYIDSPEYQSYYVGNSSKEHYRLLRYLSNQVSDSILIDIGTLKGSSALALSQNKTNTVYSFNVHNELQLNQLPSNINFIIGHVMNEEYKNLIFSSKIILLDTFHDGTFEKQFFDYLLSIDYKGCLILDDIHLNPSMEKFWREISGVVDKKDISNIGHWSGTGCVYF